MLHQERPRYLRSQKRSNMLPFKDAQVVKINPESSTTTACLIAKVQLRHI